MAKLTVQGEGTHEVEPGQTLLEACEDAGFPMECECGGFAACNSCRVVVIRHPDNLSPKLEEEDPFLDGPNHRLGCQATLLGDVEVKLDPGM